MRFNNRKTLEDQAGEIRTVRKFLLIPRDFGGPTTRCLGFEYIVEMVLPLEIGDMGTAWEWCEVGFADTMSLDDLRSFRQPERASWFRLRAHQNGFGASR